MSDSNIQSFEGIKGQLSIKQRWRRPLWFVQKRVAKLEILLVEIEHEDDLELRENHVKRAQEEYSQIERQQGLILVPLFGFYFLLNFCLASSHDQATRSHCIVAALLIVLIIYFSFFFKQLSSMEALRRRIIAAAGPVLLPDLLSRFPTLYEQEYKYPVGQYHEMERTTTLLKNPRAKEVLTDEMKVKLLSYCDSVDRYPRMDSKDKRWAAEIRSALELL